MALLNAATLLAAYKQCSDQIMRAGETTSLTKDDWKAMVAAADGWADGNAASYNSALPLPGRTTASAKQKIMVLMYVLAKRWEAV